MPARARAVLPAQPPPRPPPPCPPTHPPGTIDINGALSCFGNGTSTTLPAPAIITDTGASWNIVSVGAYGHICAITDDLTMAW